MHAITLRSAHRFEAINLTAAVQDAVRSLGLRNGAVLVHCPHTTASLVVNEAADPDVMRDLLEGWDRLVPRNGPYRHAEGNSQAHLLSGLAGCGVCLPVEGGKVVLGRWQGIFFLEFDGPRSREVRLQPLAGVAP